MNRRCNTSLGFSPGEGISIPPVSRCHESFVACQVFHRLAMGHWFWVHSERRYSAIDTPERSTRW